MIAFQFKNFEISSYPVHIRKNRDAKNYDICSCCSENCGGTTERKRFQKEIVEKIYPTKHELSREEINVKENKNQLQ